MLPLIDTPETEEQIRHHRVFGYKVEQENQDLVGRMFVHSGTGRLYEVSHIYWDTAHRRLAAYRRNADGEPANPADAIPYSVRGTNGIRQLVEDYETKAGLQATIPWPDSEVAMLTAQATDDNYQPIIEHLRQ
jgi:hypothetical protein